VYNNDTDMLFPSRVIPKLKDLRGKKWDELIAQVEKAATLDPDHLAFVLMMIQLGGCSSCHADSYRAMRGCTSCAQQTIRRFRGSDEELLENFKSAREEMLLYVEDRVSSSVWSENP
jgi:hypothetical protein